MHFLKRRIQNNIFLLIFVLSCFLFNGAHALTIVGSENISVTAIVENPTNPTPSTGGAVVLPPNKSGVGFSGYAYPGAAVTLLKNTVLVTHVRADDTGFFSISTSEPYNSTHIYTIYADDLNQERSLLLNYPLVISMGTFTQISNILFAPTVVTDKTESQASDSLIIEGYGRPQKQIVITIKEGQLVKKIYEVMTNASGKYSFTISLESFPDARYTLSAQYKEVPKISKLVSFLVGKKTTPRESNTSAVPGDCSLDRKINLTDFSILAYWYGRENPPICIDTNKDGKINLVDFSILAYYWTG